MLNYNAKKKENVMEFGHFVTYCKHNYEIFTIEAKGKFIAVVKV